MMLNDLLWEQNLLLDGQISVWILLSGVAWELGYDVSLVDMIYVNTNI